MKNTVTGLSLKSKEREIEPYYLIFKWTNWYVYGYCILRKRRMRGGKGELIKCILLMQKGF